MGYQHLRTIIVDKSPPDKNSLYKLAMKEIS